MEAETILSLDEQLDLLAALQPYEFEGQRLLWLKDHPGFRPKVLQAEYDERRAKLFPMEKKASGGGSKIVCVGDEAWTEAVDGGLILNELSAFVRRFVIFQRPEDADTFALWVMSTFCVDHFDILPYFGATAPSSECGKSTLLEVLMNFVCRALPASSASGPVVYRAIELYRPTIILDEMDTINDDSNKELLKIFNAGHKRAGAVVLRCASDDSSTPEKFNCFGPKAFGMIGKPPRTMLSRSLIINLLRKSPDEHVEKFNLRHMPGVSEMLLRVRRQCTRWAQDHADELRTHIPDTTGIGNRPEDNWEPLFTISDLAGRGWPDRARAAAKLPPLHQKQTDADLLLEDVHNIFVTRKAKQLPTKTLLADLLAQHESAGRWHRFHTGLQSKLDGVDLAELLAAFEIRPKVLSFYASQQEVLPGFDPMAKKWQKRGYALKELQPVFDRFLSAEAKETTEEVELSSEPPY